ncbi:LolA family protein [Moheibacter sediminis]|uniref:Outer membrane lipoprotein carrier protein n=1 Tax=Moheibacter sediminis TaxID=1434700 RepID=A0A1W1YES9_9FLAO|nr:outer membrane lipoprotein carrier protein LolA [Moheibacter sediminis]SMC34667.1 outer membrane lipoprotein carrier protein [Moheibacter sediminis]
MNPFKLCILFLFLGGMLLAQTKLNSAEIKTFKQNITSNSKEMKSLQCDFKQTKHLDFMENDVKSSGKLYYKSSNKIRWEYTSPFSYYVIFSNEKMFVNDNGKKKETELSSSKLLKDINKIMLSTVNGSGIFDETKFSISYYKSGSDFLATMIPTDKNYKKYIKQIDLTFDSKTFFLKKMKSTEPSLDYTLVEFSNQKKNATIADEKFSFK